jgi:hypothetical protein
LLAYPLDIARVPKIFCPGRGQSGGLASLTG